MENSLFLQAFHTLTPCLSIFWWSEFILAFFFKGSAVVSKLSLFLDQEQPYGSACRLPFDRHDGLILRVAQPTPQPPFQVEDFVGRL